MATITKNDVALRTYPGGKNGAGVYQRLINMMPPHEAYVEPFLGSGAVMRRKRPARFNFGLDLSDEVIQAHRRDGRGRNKSAPCGVPSIWHFAKADAVWWLGDSEYPKKKDTLIYLDPPYLGSVRSEPRRVFYEHELMEDWQHEELLRILLLLPAMVMISGYESELYNTLLAGWRKATFTAQTRGGPKVETVWMNFPEPKKLHDYSFLGRDFHDRTRIARKIARWTSKLRRMPVLEREAILDALLGFAN